MSDRSDPARRCPPPALSLQYPDRLVTINHSASLRPLREILLVPLAKHAKVARDWFMLDCSWLIGEVGCERSEGGVGGGRSEVGSQMSEVGRRNKENGRRKTEDGRRREEVTG